MLVRETSVVLLAVCAICAVAAAGCGAMSNLSNSVSESVSNSVQSSSESSSNSSGGDDSAYLGDVETLAIAYLEQPAQPETFLRDLARVAAEHGVSDWEASPRTLEAIGAGLRRGGASPAALDAFVARYLAELPGAALGVRRGYLGRGPARAAAGARPTL